MANRKKLKDRILIVDDDETITELLSVTLKEEGYQCEVANSSPEALTFLQKCKENQFTLSLIDMMMPVMDGYGLQQQILKKYPETGVLVISAVTNIDRAIESMRNGALDFLIKPFDINVVIPRVQNALERMHLKRENDQYQKYLEDKLESRTSDLIKKHRSLQKLYISTVEAIVRAIEAKDPYTVGHSKRVSKYCALIAKEMSVNPGDLQDIEIAGLLHDVGKIGISDAILTKASRLTIEEYESIKDHPMISLNIIEPIEEFSKVKEYVKHHHEKWDGTGYPDGLKGDNIPLGARILSVADALDTMWIGRKYHDPWDLKTVIAEFEKNKETQFDANVINSFVNLIKESKPAFDSIRVDFPPRYNEEDKKGS